MSSFSRVRFHFWIKSWMAWRGTSRQRSTTSALAVEYTPGTSQRYPAKENSPEKGSCTPGRSRWLTGKNSPLLVTYHTEKSGPRYPLGKRKGSNLACPSSMYSMKHLLLFPMLPQAGGIVNRKSPGNCQG